MHTQRIASSQARLETRSPCLAHARRVHINDGCCQQAVAKAEPRPRRQKFSRRGDERAAIVNRPTRFIAEQIRVNVAHAKCPRAFEHEAFSHFQFSEREVTRARIQNQIDTVQRQRRARPVRHPGILANLKSNANAANVEMQVSDGKCLAAGRNKLVAHACRPRFEPTRFIMNSVAGQKPLSHKAN